VTSESAYRGPFLGECLVYIRNIERKHCSGEAERKGLGIYAQRGGFRGLLGKRGDFRIGVSGTFPGRERERREGKGEEKGRKERREGREREKRREGKRKEKGRKEKREGKEREKRKGEREKRKGGKRKEKGKRKKRGSFFLDNSSRSCCERSSAPKADAPRAGAPNGGVCCAAGTEPLERCHLQGGPTSPLCPQIVGVE